MEITDIYGKLKRKHGNPGGQWDLWCRRPKTTAEKEAVIIESILTQRANWKNVMLAEGNLKKHAINCLGKILACREESLETLVRPSGFYRIKARRLKTLAGFIEKSCGGVEEAADVPTGILRQGLLSLNGVGEETADDILLYAFERPVFVIDEYTRRLAKKLNLADNFSYGHLQAVFEKGIGEKDYAVYQDFHALIVIDAKTVSVRRSVKKEGKAAG